jgi:Signal transduction histidine kinase regulating citrate/malate metabolism
LHDLVYDKKKKNEFMSRILRAFKFKKLRELKLKTRMTLVLGVMALIQTGGLGVFALNYLDNALEDQMAARALEVAKTIAIVPEVVEAVANRNSEVLQPLSLLLADASHARFVVIGDKVGVRLSHPNVERLGKPMHDDEGDHNEIALLEGKSYTQVAVGSLGPSIRGKAPIFSVDGESVIGIVSVGFALTSLETILISYRTTLIVVILGAFVLSVLIAIWFANHFKKAIFGLEPEQIGSLFEERNATLESVREGIIAINADGEVTTFNRAAVNTLNLPDKASLMGQPINKILPDSQLFEVLEDGQPQFDREFWLGDLCLIANRLPVKEGEKIIGVVSSFRPKNELDMVSRKLTRIKQYADSLRSQTHEYSNKLHTIAGLIQIGATKDALALIGQETENHQALMHLLVEAVPDPILAGCLLGKFNRARELGLMLTIDSESHMTDIPDHIAREQLVSILGNLLDNAFEATLEHSGRGGEVTLTMTDFGNDLIFEIEDQGAGIPTELQERIFTRGVSSKNEPGHGIGLHLVHTLLQRISATVTIEPADTGGSRFTVYIPKITPSKENKTMIGVVS